MSAARQVIVIGAGIIGASIAWHLTQGRSAGYGHRRQRRRRRRHAEFLCLDQCQLGQSGAVFPAAHPRHGRMDAAGGGPARPFRSPGAAACAGTCRRPSSKPMPPNTPPGVTASNVSTAPAPHASSPISPRFPISPCMCRGRRCRAGRCHAGASGRRRTAWRAHHDRNDCDRADADQRQGCRRGHTGRIDRRRRGGDCGRCRFARRSPRRPG